MSQVVRRVGRYEILREVGRGGMAIVYLARQADLDRDVALKELAAFHAADAAFAERFVRESRIAGSLSHPNIVTVHDFFEHAETPYIAMEYLDRGSLRPFIGRLTLAQIAGVLEGLLAGLAHAAGQGVVHRDLKPENVMVTADGRIKIADFGIAKALNRAGTGHFLTATGTTMGTPAYMAPEQAVGSSVGPWTDLYSVGVMAYELLVGEVPFEDTDTPLAILMRHVNEPIRPPRSVNPDLDPALADWIERLLAKAPEDRTRSAVEASDSLEEIVIRVLGPRWRRDSRLLPPRTRLTPPTVAARHDVPASRDGVETCRPPPTAWESEPPVATETATGAPSLSSGTEALRVPRRRALLVVLTVALGGAATAAAVLLGGGSDSKQTKTQPIGPKAVADPLPPPRERLALATVGNSIYLADPRGSVARIATGTLKRVASLADPDAPRAILASARGVYIADSKSIFRLRTNSLAPDAAFSFPGALALAAGTRGPAAAVRSVGRADGELCAVPPAPRSCANLGFSPTGLGVSGAGTAFYVTDGAAGTIVRYTLATGRPVRDSIFRLSRRSKPHGTVIALGRRLFVSVVGGIAVVDPRGRTSLISLPGTPVSLSATPTQLFAPLYARKKLAVVDLRASKLAPTLVGTGGSPASVAVGAGARTAYVVTTPIRTIAKVRGQGPVEPGPSRGTALTGSPRRATVLGRPVVSQESTQLTIALPLKSGRLDARNLTPTDLQLRDGSASFRILQGGAAVASGAGSTTSGGLTLILRPAPGGLVVRLSAESQRFLSLTAPSLHGRSIVLVATEKAVIRQPPTSSQPTTTAPQQTTTAPPPTIG